MQGRNLLLGLLTFIIILGGLSIAYGDCTGCGDDVTKFVLLKRNIHTKHL